MANDLSWSIGADWINFRRGINDAKKHGEEALASLGRTAVRAGAVFGQPFKTRNIEYASLHAAHYGKALAAMGVAVGAALASVFINLPLKAFPHIAKLPAFMWRQFLKVTTALENHFPKLFAGLMKIPGLEKALRFGPITALKKELEFAFKSLPNSVQRYLRGAWSELKSFGNLFLSISKVVWSGTKIIIKGIFGIISVLTKLAAVGAATFTAVAVGLAGAVAHFTGLGKELDDVSRTSGIAGDEILRTQLMLQRLNVSSEDASGLLTEMRSKLYEASTGFGDGARWAALMGLNVHELVSMRPSEAFERIAAAVNNIGNPYQRMLAADTLIGSMGAKAAALAVSGKEVDTYFGQYIRLLNGAKEQMFGLWMAWQRIKMLGTTFFASMTTKIVPVIRPLLEKLETFLPKMVQYGAAFGEHIANAVRVLYNIFNKDKTFDNKSPFQRMVSIVKLGLVAALRYAGNLVVAIFAGVKDILIWAFKSAVGVLFELLKKAFETAGQIMVNPWAYANAKKQYAEEGAQLAGSLQLAVKAYKDAIARGDTVAAEKLRKRIMELQGLVDQAIENSKNPPGYNLETFAGEFTDAIKAAITHYKEALAKDPFHAKKAGEDLVKELNKYKFQVSAESFSEKKIGKSGIPFLYGGFVNVFDDLRKIGGGIGASNVNLKDRMVEYLRQIAGNTDPRKNRSPMGRDGYNSPTARDYGRTMPVVVGAGGY